MQKNQNIYPQGDHILETLFRATIPSHNKLTQRRLLTKTLKHTVTPTSIPVQAHYILCSIGLLDHSP
jgi:hypothetical protein